LLLFGSVAATAQERSLAQSAEAGMQRAAAFYSNQVADHGGYVYYYSLDLKRRWGEGEAEDDQVWVQPPGTPTVGMAFLNAWRATGDAAYLKAATAAAEALVYGQLQSGDWTNSIDFNPRGSKVSLYRNGKGKGRNFSTLDDDISPSAIRLLMQVDQAHRFQHQAIHESAAVALNALLKAQFQCGAFPQGWDETPAPNGPGKNANYPQHDWRTEGRIKNYWDMYTINDNVPGAVAQMLIEAHRVYGDERYLASLRRLGDFLLLAQMPEPQPGWAQQYNYEMQPIWARKFEPPAVSGDETQETIETLLTIYHATGEEKYLAPIPAALQWLKRSQLSDGQIARYYELESNRPLYMFRKGKVYTLTHDDSNLPRHYGWKAASRIEDLQQAYAAAKANGPAKLQAKPRPSKAEVGRILAELDEQGRWITTYESGARLVGQPKFPIGMKYIDSGRFAENLSRLASFVARE